MPHPSKFAVELEFLPRPPISVFKTANTALEPALRVLPHPLDDARVVVAVGKIVIQRGAAVFLAGLLHAVQLIAVK